VTASDKSATPLLLSRPDEQRLREHKYRFSQAVVFGLPVLFLQVCGRALGGPESERWVAVLQALLAGWVTYVAATGMLFEGIVVLIARGRATGDLLAAAASLALYGFSVLSVLYLPFAGRLGYRPLLFHVVVILLGVWTGAQWWRWSRRIAA
jgi:cation transport ATPase